MTNENNDQQIRPATPEEARQYAIPTGDDTQNAIDQIGKKRDEVAAYALRELALAVIDAVNRIDTQLKVHNYLKSLEILCEGPGIFRLNIEDKNTECDPQKLADNIADQLNKESVGDYYKQARSIQVEFNNVEETDGPDWVSPGKT